MNEPKEAYAILLRALQAEARKKRGQIGRAESALGRERGYLSKVFAGKRPITAEGLLTLLHALDVDLGAFFSVFGRSLSPRSGPDLDEFLGPVSPDVDDPLLKSILEVVEKTEAEIAGLDT